MAKIIKTDDLTVTVGFDDGSFEAFDRKTCSGFTPAVGIEVNVYRNGNEVIISAVPPARSASAAPAQPVPHQVDKFAYVVLCFFLGGIGAHKFYAGHTVLGFIYLLFCWTAIPAFIAFIELIIGLIKPSDANGRYIA